MGAAAAVLVFPGDICAQVPPQVSFRLIHMLSDDDGEWPFVGLAICNNTLYGTASHGGTNGNGTVFAVNTDGTDFRLIHTFSVTTQVDYEALGRNGRPSRARRRYSSTGRPCLRSVQM